MRVPEDWPKMHCRRAPGLRPSITWADGTGGMAMRQASSLGIMPPRATLDWINIRAPRGFMRGKHRPEESRTPSTSVRKIRLDAANSWGQAAGNGIAVNVEKLAVVLVEANGGDEGHEAGVEGVGDGFGIDLGYLADKAEFRVRNGGTGGVLRRRR